MGTGIERKFRVNGYEVMMAEVVDKAVSVMARP